MQNSNINFNEPATLRLAHMLKCAPANAPDHLATTISNALAEIRKRFSFLRQIDFPLFFLDEKLMSYRLITLTSEHLASYPNASTEDILIHLLGNNQRLRGHYLLSIEEERTLIIAYQQNVRGSVEMALTFFAPKIIATLRPLLFGIKPENHQDIEAVCLASLDKLIKAFDIENFTIGLPQNLVSLELSNDILEEFGQNYSIPIHRRQINHLRRLHSMMQDEGFATLPQDIRAKQAGIPLAVVVLYDNQHTDIDTSSLTAIPYLAMSIVEERYDASLAEKDELFRCLEDIVIYWLDRHQTRPSVAGKKILKAFSEIKEQKNISDDDFDVYEQDIIAWMKAHADQLLP